MGDRCYFRVSVHPDFADLFARLVFGEAPPKGGWKLRPEGVEFQDDEWQEFGALTEAAKEGAIFYGEHGSGCEYDGHDFVAWDGQLTEVVCGADNCHYISIDESGEPNPGQVENAKDYARCLILAKDAIRSAWEMKKAADAEKVDEKALAAVFAPRPGEPQ